MDPSAELLRGFRVTCRGAERAIGIAARRLADLGASVSWDQAPDDRRDRLWLGELQAPAAGERADVAIVGAGTAPAPPAASVVELLATGSRSEHAGESLDERRVAAVAGVAIAIGEPDRPPLPLPEGCLDALVGTHVAGAALTAALEGVARVEVAAADVAAWMVATNRQLYVPYGLPWRRDGRRASGSGSCYPYGLFDAADGLFCLIGRTDRDWDSLREAMGSPAWAREERFADPRRLGRQYPGEADLHLNRWTATHTRAELFETVGRHSFPGAPVLDPAEVLALPSLAGRWLERGEGLRAPGSPVDALFPAAEAGPGPLAGALVLDLSWVWSGPAVSVGLADLGATVIKVESATRPDNTRMRGAPVSLRIAAGAPPLELAPYFHVLNRGKRSVSLDLRRDDARGLLAGLAAKADVIVENLSAGVMDRFGIAPARVLETNPACTFVSMRGYRPHPTTEGLRAYAPVLSSGAGIEALVGYPGEPAVGAMTVAFSDGLAASDGQLCVLAGLLGRRLNRRGAALTLSQLESAVFANGRNLLADQLGGRPAGLQPLLEREGPIAGEADLGSSPWLSPDLFTTIQTPHVGAVEVARLPWRREGELRSAPAPPPELGAHTNAELRRLLGLSGAEIERLRTAGALA